MKRKLLALVLALAMVVSLLPTWVVADGSQTRTVSSFEELSSYVGAAQAGDTIRLTGDFSCGENVLPIVVDKDITLDFNRSTITFGNYENYSLFQVTSGATLTLTDISNAGGLTADGGKLFEIGTECTVKITSGYYVQSRDITTGEAFAYRKNGNNGVLEITGGKFNFAPDRYAYDLPDFGVDVKDSSCVAEGYAATSAGDPPIWTVAPAATNVAKIGTTEYATLQEAFNAAAAGDTVEVLAASDENIDLTALSKSKGLMYFFNPEFVDGKEADAKTNAAASGVVFVKDAKNTFADTYTYECELRTYNSEGTAEQKLSTTKTIFYGDMETLADLYAKDNKNYATTPKAAGNQCWKDTGLVTLITECITDGTRNYSIIMPNRNALDSQDTLVVEKDMILSTYSGTGGRIDFRLMGSGAFTLDLNGHEIYQVSGDNGNGIATTSDGAAALRLSRFTDMTIVDSSVGKTGSVVGSQAVVDYFGEYVETEPGGKLALESGTLIGRMVPALSGGNNDDNASSYHDDNEKGSIIRIDDNGTFIMIGGALDIDRQAYKHSNTAKWGEPKLWPCAAAIQVAPLCTDATITLSGGSIERIALDQQAETNYAPDEHKEIIYYDVNDDNVDLTVSENVVIYPTNVAKINDTEYATLAEAIAAVSTDGTETTITMIGDEVLENGVTIPATKKIILDLNGKTISSVKNEAAGSALVLNRGVLTVTDTSEGADGKLTTEAIQPDLSGVPGYANNTILNQGKLTVCAGSIINTSDNGAACYAIDNDYRGGGSPSVLEITGGTVTSSGKNAIRQYLTSSGENKVTITGGTVKSLWVQDDGANNVGSLTIKNATFTGGVTVGYYDESEHFALDIENSTFGGLVQYKLDATKEENTIVYKNNVAAPFYMTQPSKILDDTAGKFFIAELVNIGWVLVNDINAYPTAEGLDIDRESLFKDTDGDWYQGYVTPEGQIKRFAEYIKTGYELVPVENETGTYHIVKQEKQIVTESQATVDTTDNTKVKVDDKSIEVKVKETEDGEATDNTNTEVATKVAEQINTLLENTEVSDFGNTGIHEAVTEATVKDNNYDLTKILKALKDEAQVKYTQNEGTGSATTTADNTITVRISNEADGEDFTNTDVKTELKIAFQATVVTTETKTDEQTQTIVKLSETTYDVKPYATITVQNGDVKESVTVQITNDMITKPITFRLPVPEYFGEYATVTHTPDEGDKAHTEETFVKPVHGSGEKKYVELSSDHFSMFTLGNANVTEEDYVAVEVNGQSYLLSQFPQAVEAAEAAEGDAAIMYLLADVAFSTYEDDEVDEDGLPVEHYITLTENVNVDRTTNAPEGEKFAFLVEREEANKAHHFVFVNETNALTVKAVVTNTPTGGKYTVGDPITMDIVLMDGETLVTDYAGAYVNVKFTDYVTAPATAPNGWKKLDDCTFQFYNDDPNGGDLEGGVLGTFTLEAAKATGVDGADITDIQNAGEFVADVTEAYSGDAIKITVADNAEATILGVMEWNTTTVANKVFDGKPYNKDTKCSAKVVISGTTTEITEAHFEYALYKEDEVTALTTAPTAIGKYSVKVTATAEGYAPLEKFVKFEITEPSAELVVTNYFGVYCMAYIFIPKNEDGNAATARVTYNGNKVYDITNLGYKFTKNEEGEFVENEDGTVKLERLDVASDSTTLGVNARYKVFAALIETGTTKFANASAITKDNIGYIAYNASLVGTVPAMTKVNDVNATKKVDLADAVAVVTTYTNANLNYMATILRCDVNGDGKVDTEDAGRIKSEVTTIPPTPTTESESGN